MSTQYLDTDGKPIFVSDGIGGKEFGAFKRRASGSLKRVVSKALPMVTDKAEAQTNLDKWARAHKLKVKDDNDRTSTP